MTVGDCIISAGLGMLVGLLFGVYLSAKDPSHIVKQCNDRMYFIADDGMYLCKRHEPFK